MRFSYKKFLIYSSEERVEQLVMKAMIDALQPEMMEASDEKSFRAVVKTKIGPIALPMRMAGEIISQLNPVEFMIKIRGQGGLIWLDQKAKFILTSLAKGKTEVECELVAEGMSPIVRIFLIWRVKSFAAEILDGFEERLKQWA